MKNCCLLWVLVLVLVGINLETHCFGYMCSAVRKLYERASTGQIRPKRALSYVILGGLGGCADYLSSSLIVEKIRGERKPADRYAVGAVGLFVGTVMGRGAWAAGAVRPFSSYYMNGAASRLPITGALSGAYLSDAYKDSEWVQTAAPAAGFIGGFCATSVLTRALEKETLPCNGALSATKRFFVNNNKNIGCFIRKIFRR